MTHREMKIDLASKRPSGISLMLLWYRNLQENEPGGAAADGQAQSKNTTIKSSMARHQTALIVLRGR
jgi:hypothetical protein